MAPTVLRRAEPDLAAVARDALDRAAVRVSDARRLVVAHSLATLEPVELPPVAGGPDAARSLAELAPMYLLSELDAAGLFVAGDRLAGRYAEGSLGRVGAAEVALAELWRSRHRRFGAAERAALFGRLFGGQNRPSLAGGSQNHAFEALLARFADAVIGEGTGRADRMGADLVRIGIAGERLVATAVGYGMAVPRLASQELLDHARFVLSVIQERAVQAAVGRSTAWGVVAALRDPVGPGRRPAGGAVAAHVLRGRAGVILLGWLADASGGSRTLRLPAPPAEVVAAAFDWLEATLGAPTVAGS